VHFCCHVSRNLLKMQFVQSWWQEEKVASTLSNVKRMTVETAAKQKTVRLKEQAVIEREGDLRVSAY
jgi:hypothetical protein